MLLRPCSYLKMVSLQSTVICLSFKMLSTIHFEKRSKKVIEVDQVSKNYQETIEVPPKK